MEKLNLREKKLKGSLTVEAAFIIPMMTCIIILVMYLCIFMYSRCYAQIAINNSLSRASSSWYGVEDSLAVKGYSESVVNSSALGYVLTGINTPAIINEKLNALENDIKNKIINYTPMKVEVNVNIDRTNLIVAESIDVNVECKYKLPIKGIFGVFNIGDEEGIITDKVSKNVVISSAESQTRSFSFAKKTMQRIVKANKSLDTFTDRVKEVKDGIKKFLK